MYEFQDLTPISGHFRKNFKISGQRPGLVLWLTCRRSTWMEQVVLLHSV